MLLPMQVPFSCELLRLVPVCNLCCSLFSARLLQLEGKIGLIAEGAYGDIIILDANPLEDITVLDNPDKHLLAVIKAGHVFRSRLESLPVDVVY